MDCQRIYDNLIKKRLENPPTEKFERHHIVPRSLGGSNLDDNIVKLTYREHYVAHLLLCKIYKPKGGENYARMLFAFNRMQTGRDGSQVKNSRMFEYFREDFVNLLGCRMSEVQKGEGNSQHGTSWYYHPDLMMNAKFRPGDKIPAGFIKGRVVRDSKGGINDLRKLGIIEKLPRRKNYLKEVECVVNVCEYCGNEFEASVQAKGEVCKSCIPIYFKLNPSSRVEGRDYLTDEQIIELHEKFMESGLSIKRFQPQCGYNVTDNYLYSRWRRLGLQAVMNKKKQ